MLAIELVKILLGVGAYLLGLVGIIWLFLDQDSNLPNSLLILAAISLLTMFHI